SQGACLLLALSTLMHRPLFIVAVAWPRTILPAAARLPKTSNHMTSAGIPFSVQPTSPRLAGPPPTRGADQDRTTELGPHQLGRFRTVRRASPTGIDRN